MRKAVFLLVLLLSTAARADYPSPAGEWRTFDDKTGKERSLVRLEERNGALFGIVVSTVDPAESAKTCDKCDDDRKGKPSIGLEVIRDMKLDNGIWKGGTLLDPETGGIYHGTIRLEPDGSHLVLRGYIGIPLLGRSQTWVRATP
jgi:uncharacterized protein (DUF2147 family)